MHPRAFPRSFIIAILACVAALTMCAQSTPQTALLWPAGAPDALSTQPSDQPKLTLFALPKDPTHLRSAVIILPGGGYHVLVTSYEGADPAKWANQLGLSAFMLQYRIGPNYHYPIQLEDAARAMRWVRSHAAEYGIDPHRIGVWGFSAGGHLASLLATHYDFGNPNATDLMDRVSSRPDFAILCYPVIDPIGPGAVDTFHTLFGPAENPQLVQQISSDLHVTSNTPPTFLVQAGDDPIVSPESSIRFYLALQRAKVPAELHIYQAGGHGFGLAPLNPNLSLWTQQLANWLHLQGLDNTK